MYKPATAAVAVALGISLSAIPAMSADDNKTLKNKAVDAKDTVKEKPCRLDADTKSHLMGQASSGATATTPSASPAAEKPSAAPSAGGSPSAAPAPPSKTEKP